MSPHEPIQINATSSNLSFALLRQQNVARCEAVFLPLLSWSPTDWATAMAGECGEACNFVKKLRRGDCVTRDQIAKELADTIIYTDLLAARLGIDLGAAVINKFNSVSDERECPIKLTAWPTECCPEQ